MSQPHRFQRKPLAAALGIALLPLVSSPVQAQLEEVVVTATKQEASLQDVPVAVSALTEDSIDQRGISNFAVYFRGENVAGKSFGNASCNIHC